MSAATLAELGIVLRHLTRPGEHRTRCPWCDRKGRDDALAVKVEPDGGATWICHRCGETGGIGPKLAEKNPHHEKSFPRQRQPAPQKHETLVSWAQAFWSTCKPILPGTVAATYLDRRGCVSPPWPEDSDLRWHPEVKHQKADHVGPALVALVTDIITGKPISLHRTWIKPDGSSKAEVEPVRRLLKDHRSDGVVRLWPDAEVNYGLVLGEGLETCLAAAAAGLAPVWATISAGNLRNFPVMPGLEGITVLVDHDKPNPKTGRRAGHDAAAALVARYIAAGFDPKRDIIVILPPTEGQDAADLEIHA